MKLYRYYYYFTEEGCPFTADKPIIYLVDFNIIKETKKGCWISLSEYDKSDTKWVSNTSRKRFAHRTKEEAANSLVLRTRRRIKILTKQLENVKGLLPVAEEQLLLLKNKSNVTKKGNGLTSISQNEKRRVANTSSHT